jgi:hypothetical protein
MERERYVKRSFLVLLISMEVRLMDEKNQSDSASSPGKTWEDKI